MRHTIGNLLVSCILALPFAVLAQQFPVKPIRVIVPFPPGNTADILGRLIGEKVTQRYGQQMIVENRPGASGQLGLELAARAVPDGYTIAIGQGGNLVVAPHSSQGWFGYIAPAAVPKDVIAFLNKAINEAMNFPDVREKMTFAGLEIVQQPPEYFGDIIRKDYAKYGKLAKDIGFKPQ